MFSLRYSLPQRVRSWKAWPRALLALLALSLLPLAAPAQLPARPPIRPQFAVPQIEAALRMEAERPRATGQVFVKFKTLVKPVDFARAFSAAAAEKRNKADLSADVAPALTYVRSHEAIGWHVFRLASPEALPKTLDALSRDPNVQQAVPVQGLRLLLNPPTNPRWGQMIDPHLLFGAFLVQQGLLQDTGDPRDYDSSGWHYNWTLETVNALGGWNVYPGLYPTAADRIAQLASDPSRMPRVAIIDTGIDFHHPGFAYPGPAGTNQGDRTDIAYGGQIETSLARSFYLGNTDPNPMLAADVFGHGTSLAGVIGAGPNNGYGVPGLGFPCRIVPIRIYGPDGDGDDSDLVTAILYAVDNGCLLINISARTDLGYSAPLQDACDYAWQHGTLVIAAAGNDGSDTNPEQGMIRRWPASNARVLCVGASTYGGGPVSSDTTGTYDQTEHLASYSNFGQSLGVVAPAGEAVPSTGLGTLFLNTAPMADDTLLQTLLTSLGLPSDSIPEWVFAYTTAPTYLVPLSDPTSPFGAYAQLGLYGLNEGMLPGTSLAAPLVTGLAALYAAANGITQSTPDGPLHIVQAIERGAEQLGSRPDGGFDLLFGYGRINAKATLQDHLQRTTIKGGIVGLTTFGGTVISSVGVYARKAGTTTLVSTATSTAPDGVFHLLNLPEGDYDISARILGESVSTTVHVTAGCDVFADLRAGEIQVAVAPQSANVPYGGTLKLTAQVTGTQDHRVVWSLPVNDAGATIDQNGLLTAPASPGTSNRVVAKAASVASPLRYGTAQISFGPVEVEATPNPAKGYYGKSLQLHATVHGAVDQSVTWSVVSGGGTISDTGLYHAPSAPHGVLIGKAQVKVTSTVDPNASEIVTIILRRGLPTLPTSPTPPPGRGG